MQAFEVGPAGVRKRHNTSHRAGVRMRRGGGRYLQFEAVQEGRATSLCLPEENQGSFTGITPQAQQAAVALPPTRAGRAHRML